MARRCGSRGRVRAVRDARRARSGSRHGGRVLAARSRPVTRLSGGSGRQNAGTEKGAEGRPVKRDMTMLITILEWYGVISAVSIAAFLTWGWSRGRRRTMIELPATFVTLLFAILIIVAHFKRSKILGLLMFLQSDVSRSHILSHVACESLEFCRRSRARVVKWVACAHAKDASKVSAQMALFYAQRQG